MTMIAIRTINILVNIKLLRCDLINDPDNTVIIYLTTWNLGVLNPALSLNQTQGK